MKILNIVLVAMIALLSIAAGVAKVIESPQEVQFLQGFGFNSMLIIAYGVVQIVGGILLAIPKTIKLGAIIIMLAFALSTLLIFIGGYTMYALASLLPIVLTGFIFWQSSKVTHSNKP